jgi:ribose 5-phosphate isomerase A
MSDGSEPVPPLHTAGAEHAFKAEAAASAVALVRSGMRVGLGSGTTATLALRHLAERLRSGALHDIAGCASSAATRTEAVRLGIPMLPDDLASTLDLTIDGADEIDGDLNMIKGGGGALLREKIVAQASALVVIVADDSKVSPRLGTHWPVPVEVLAFGWRSQARFLESLGAIVTMRQGANREPFHTDSGNLILDCRFAPIDDATALAAMLAARAGIVEHGLFIGLAHEVIVAGPAGVAHHTRAW